MPKEEVDIFLSHQAELFLKEMPDVKREDLVKWFANVRRISISGGDIYDYLKYLNEKKKAKVND